MDDVVPVDATTTFATGNIGMDGTGPTRQTCLSVDSS